MGNALQKHEAGHGPADYDGDFYLWTIAQAAALRRLKFNPAGVDVENIATEIEDLGKRELRSLRSYTTTALEHAIKLICSPAQEPRRGWMETVYHCRREIHLLIEDSPSLAGRAEHFWQDCLREALTTAMENLRAWGEADNLPFTITLEHRQFMNPAMSTADWLTFARRVVEEDTRKQAEMFGGTIKATKTVKGSTKKAD